MTIDAGALPMPSQVDRPRELCAMEGTQPTAGILYMREPDPQVRPGVWSLVYERVAGAVVRAIRLHFREHAYTDFDWTPPGATDPIRVIHDGPPDVRWDTPQSATVRVDLEQVLAHD